MFVGMIIKSKKYYGFEIKKVGGLTLYLHLHPIEFIFRERMRNVSPVETDERIFVDLLFFTLIIFVESS